MSYLPTVDIVIPCYNVGHVVGKCINSVLNQKYDNTFHLYVVNDGSTDNTGTILDSFAKMKNSTVIHHKKNMGLSSARNSGIKAGKNDVICFLDSDMTVNEHWLKSHINCLSGNSIVGVIGDSKLPEGVIPNSLDTYLYDKRRGARQFGENVPIPFQYFLFNNTSVKRAVFDKIALFDETIKSYGGEDTEVAIRLWEAYPNCLRFSSEAISEHRHPREFHEFLQSMFHYGNTNLPTIMNRHPTSSRALAGDLVFSKKGYLLFNPIARKTVRFLRLLWDDYWLKRYLIIDAVIRGARECDRPQDSSPLEE